MRRLIVAVLAVLLAGTAVAELDSERELIVEFSIPEGERLEVGLKFGELQIETAATDKVTFEVEARCREGADPKCFRRLENLDVELEPAPESGTLIQVTGLSKRYHRMEIEATVVVPESSPLVVKMYAGELDVAGGGQDLDIRLKYGDATVTQPLAATKSVLADANFGDSQIFAPLGETDSGRPWLVGSRVTWDEGEGASTVILKLSAGDATVHLE